MRATFVITEAYPPPRKELHRRFVMEYVGIQRYPLSTVRNVGTP